MRIISKIIRTLLVVICVIITSSSASVYQTSVENTNISKTVNLSTMAMKISENEEARLYTPLSSYIGDLTGYVYNCPLCTGRLACMSSLDLSNGTTTYNDITYGEVNIVASSSNLPCGTIVRFNSERINAEPTFAIVLDRGVIGTSLDLLVKDLDTAVSTVGRSSIDYDVLRIGYGEVEE